MIEFRHLVTECGVPLIDIPGVLDFLVNNTGQILYLPTGDKSSDSDYIILQPQWLATVLSSVITFQHRFIKNGVLQKEEVSHVLTKFPSEQHPMLLDYLEKFRVLVYIKKLD